jgi:DNA recombination protein RmuC
MVITETEWILTTVIWAIIGLVIGIAAGGAVVWWWQHSRGERRLSTQCALHEASLADLKSEHDKSVGDLQLQHREKEADLEKEIAVLKSRLEQAASAQELLESAKIQFSEAAKLTAAEALQNNNQQFLDLAKENFGSTLETAQRELDQRHQQFQELVKPLSENYSQLTDTFQTTATAALQNNSKQFLELAQENWGKTLESAKSEFHQRHQQFQELVKPLADSYNELNPQIKTLTEQVTAVTGETAKLAGALKGDNQAVGNWGEMQLSLVVEKAGMTAYCDFSEQQTTGNSQDRPDLTVHLPEGRAVVIDAKASTAAFLEVSEAQGDEAAQAAYARHASALQRQVDALAARITATKLTVPWISW